VRKEAWVVRLWEAWEGRVIKGRGGGGGEGCREWWGCGEGCREWWGCGEGRGGSVVGGGGGAGDVVGVMTG